MLKTKALQASHLSKTFLMPRGESFEALKDINLTIAQGEFVSLLGTSGCGKTTLLKLLAGLIEPTEGQVTASMESGHGKGLVFQQYNLFPWLNVRKNVAFGLSIGAVERPDIDNAVLHCLQAVGLERFQLHYPHELSGGMQQRVALARTLATDPSILFMDEPFSALDMQTKRSMQDLLLKLIRDKQRTVVFVTHDVEEAVLLSDTIYIMGAHPGTIIEKVPVTLHHPRSLDMEFSEAFIDIKKRVQRAITSLRTDDS